jgi:hypothetical protein
MKLTQKIVALTGIVAIAATPLFAGTGKTFKETVVVEEEATPWYSATLSTGYDSLYMYRGANLLGSGKYGDSLYWTSLAFTWNITENDALTFAGWQAFGLGDGSYGGSYKEFDASVLYTHTIDALTLGLGYTFYFVFPASGNTYANELNASVAYELDLGFMSLTPSVTYFFNLGPDFEDFAAETGGVATASSFLNLKLAGGIPVYKEIVSLAPYSALNINFGYNQTANQSGGYNTFDGLNNWEIGLAMPIAVNDIITITGYVAYSYAFENLWGTTQPSTFWGGGNIAFTF